MSMIHSIAPISREYNHTPHVAPIQRQGEAIAEILEIIALEDAAMLDGTICGYRHRHNNLELVTYYTNHPKHVDILA